MGGVVPALQLSTRAALAAALAVALAQWIGLAYPLYAMIAAVIVTDLDPVQTRSLALTRIAGTALGVVLGASMSLFLPHGPIAIGVGIFVAMFVSHLLGRKDAARLAGYGCALVVLGYSGEPWTYALFRFVETLLGIVVALAVSALPKVMGEPRAAS